jgi:hypothetical protein
MMFRRFIRVRENRERHAEGGVDQREDGPREQAQRRVRHRERLLDQRQQNAEDLPVQIVDDIHKGEDGEHEMAILRTLRTRRPPPAGHQSTFPARSHASRTMPPSQRKRLWWAGEDAMRTWRPRAHLETHDAFNQSRPPLENIDLFTSDIALEGAITRGPGPPNIKTGWPASACAAVRRKSPNGRRRRTKTCHSCAPLRYGLCLRRRQCANRGERHPHSRYAAFLRTFPPDLASTLADAKADAGNRELVLDIQLQVDIPLAVSIDVPVGGFSTGMKIAIHAVSFRTHLLGEGE